MDATALSSSSSTTGSNSVYASSNYSSENETTMNKSPNEEQESVKVKPYTSIYDEINNTDKDKKLLGEEKSSVSLDKRPQDPFKDFVKKEKPFKKKSSARSTSKKTNIPATKQELRQLKQSSHLMSNVAPPSSSPPPPPQVKTRTKVANSVDQQLKHSSPKIASTLDKNTNKKKKAYK